MTVNDQKNWVKHRGVLVYNPPRPDLRKIRQGNDWFIFLELDYNFAALYRWFILRRFHLQLQPTAWKPHVTVLDGRNKVQPEYRQFWKKYEKKKIEFEYSVDIEQHWKFWTLPVRSETLLDIREELGFKRQCELHITIGRMY